MVAVSGEESSEQNHPLYRVHKVIAMSVVREIQQELARLADPQKAAHLQRFFKTGPGEYAQGDLFRGIRVPELRKLAKRYQGIKLAQADELLRSAYHEDRLLALLLLVQMAGADDGPMRERVYRLYLKRTAHINNWDLVDTSAEHIIGAYLDKKPKIPLNRLARSANLWERRMAVMATFYYIKRGRFQHTLHLAEMLLDDPHDLIHKAVGWMLREVGKRDLRAEEEFLQKHCQRMPRTMLRYAIERFPEPKRRAYLSGNGKQGKAVRKT